MGKRPIAEVNATEGDEVRAQPVMVTETSDLNETKPSTDKKWYRLITLSNGLQALLISDHASKTDPSKEQELDGDEDEGSDQDEEEENEGDDSFSEGEGEEEEEEAMEEGDGDANSGQKPRKDSNAVGIRLAAAAISVNVGSFRDPASVQGLAHYLEHMLFMGSEKYPSENEYDAFISTAGGASNAMTELEYTVYHFEVPQEHFVGALDIFAQFFISPLMRPDSSARELQSIENEFHLSRGNDHCRLQQLFCHTARKGHPFSQFAWGNFKSLRDDPAHAGVNIQEELRQFHNQYYIPANMKLVLLSTDSLDALQELVLNTFGVIRNKPNSQPPPVPIATLGPPFEQSSPSFGSIYRIVPVKDIHQLYISWQLPSQLPFFRSKPCDYLSHLIGHEGAGSLLSKVKALAWATGICAGFGDGGYDNSTAHTFFVVSVSLTMQGVAHWPEVVTMLYQYIELLRSMEPQKWIFDELQATSQMQYQYQEETDSGEIVEQLSVHMLPINSYGKELLRGPFLLWDWAPEQIKEVLSCFVPSNMRIDIMSSVFGRASQYETGADATEETNGNANAVPEVSQDHSSLPEIYHPCKHLCVPPSKEVEPLREPWFGTCYWLEPIPPSLLKLCSSAGLNESFVLPKPNPFVPTDFTLKELPELTSENGSQESLEPHYEKLEALAVSLSQSPAASLPKLIFEEPPLKLWYLQDRVFLMPRTEIHLKLVTPAAFMKARDEALTDLLVRLVKDSLNETTYLASIAELYYSLKATEFGLELHFHGFNHKILNLMELVLDRLLNFEAHIQPKWFQARKEALEREYANENMKPARFARNLRLMVLKEHMWSPEEKGQECSSIDVDVLKAFLPKLFSTLRVEALYHGNATASDAQALAETICKLLKKAGTAPLEPKDELENKVVRLPTGRLVTVSEDSKDPCDRNAALEVYWQVSEDNTKTRCLLYLLEQIISEPLYDTLRTKEQLGYSVHASHRITNGILGFAVTLQSSSHEAPYLHARVESFLSDFGKKLASMADEEFARHLSAIICHKMQKDYSLFDESERYWGEIVERRYDFDVKQAQLRMLITLTKAELVEVFDRHISVTSKQAKNLCIKVHGRGAKHSAPEPKECALISCPTYTQELPIQHPRDLKDKNLSAGYFPHFPHLTQQ